MPKKIEQFDNERKEILNKILAILNINESNDTFSLHHIDENIDVQNQILALENDIKKCFFCGNWSCFKRKDFVKRRWLSMIKYVCKENNYDFVSMQLKKNGINYIDTIYSIKEK